MNILVITKAAWDDRIASGNTLSNFFEGWKGANISCLYSRDAIPNNKVCKVYYSISPISIIKNFFRPTRIGKYFSYNCEASLFNGESEAKIINTAKQNKRIFEFIYHLLYATNLWINNSFKKFINDSNPDIVFCFGQTDPLTYKALKYIKKHTNAKAVSYYVDDLYRSNTSILNFLQKQKNYYLKQISEMSDLCYAISKKMCDEYNALYGKNFQLLHKGCDVSDVKKDVNNPLRFVYAGNLFYHRDRILCALSRAIERVNRDGIKAHLDVYSATPVDDYANTELNLEGASTLHKARPFDEIKKIMQEADVVLHVESFDEEQIKLVRLSFSTKITDCMQSGSMMMAIGPDCVASIDYVTRVPGCVVVKDLDNLEGIIQEFVINNFLIIDNATKTNEFAKENVELCRLRNRIYSEFTALIME